MRLAAFAPILALTFAGLFTGDAASAAPATLPSRMIDLDLKQADIKNVLRLLANVSSREAVLDPCVHGTVDLRIKNTPSSLVLDVLALKLHLAYDDDGSTLAVHCTDGDAGSDDATRVTLAIANAPLADALDTVAKEAHLDGVDYRATARPKVEVTLKRVRLRTALTVLSDESGLKIGVVKNRLVVRD